jgi:ubiquinone/menaquinone biosynthesis C-methylase UbiE
MNWEETIKYIRTQPEYRSLVIEAYFEEDLSLNVERFRNGNEFKQTLALLKQYAPHGKRILDIGSGNGISAVAFALSGYAVTSIEPDPSDTIGAGAIRKLKDHYRLSNLEVFEAFAEELQLPSESYDIVYTRQCLHHAYDLEKFVAEMARVLKKGGLLLTIRDHVVFDESDKQWFLENHPLQKFYGGENAFSPDQYKNAMTNAGLTVIRELKYYDSAINYFPLTEKDISDLPALMEERTKISFKRKTGILAGLPFLFSLYKWKTGFKKSNYPDEKLIPGRMYSYLAQK